MSIVRDGLRDPVHHQRERVVVVSAPHQRNGLALKTAYLAVRQDRFETVTDFYSCAMVLDRVDDQDTFVGLLTADSPLLEKIDRVALDVATVESGDGDQRDLRTGLLIHLLSKPVQLRDGIGAEHVREIVDVAGGLKVLDGFRACE